MTPEEAVMTPEVRAASDSEETALTIAEEQPVPVRCQVCGARQAPDDPVLCWSCGEPVLRCGWAP